MRDMRKAIKDLLIKAIVLTILLIVIPLSVAHYIDNIYIVAPVVFVYGAFIALITDIK
jgi:hypothetical protein